MPMNMAFSLLLINSSSIFLPSIKILFLDFVRIPKSYRSLINTLEGEIVFEKESLIKEILTNVIENQIQNAK